MTQRKDLSVDVCFFDVMVTFKGERGASAAQAVAEAFNEAGAVVGQYTPLDERGVTALNYLVLGTSENGALTADADGRLAHATDIKHLLRRISSATGARVVYVTKLSETAHDVEEFADIEDAEAAQDLVFRQARSVAVGQVTRDWARAVSAQAYQDVHLTKQDGRDVALIDGGLDVSQLPPLETTSAFVYSTPLAMLARLYLPGRSLGEPVHEVNFTWFAETDPLRTFPAESEVSRVWDEALARLRSAEPLAEELSANPETAPPSDAGELWSSAADPAIVESVLTAVGLPGRAVRLAQHEGRAENLPGVSTVRSSSEEVEALREGPADEQEQEKRRSVVVESPDRTLAVGWARFGAFVLLALVCAWLAASVFSSVPSIGMWVLAVVFAAIAVVQGIRVGKTAAARRGRSDSAG